MDTASMSHSTTIRLTLFASLFLTVSCAWSATVVTLLTIDGELVSAPSTYEPALKRLGIAEGGQGVVVDEFAVITAGLRGPSIRMASEAFGSSLDDMNALVPQLESSSESRAGTSTATSGPRRVLNAREALLVRHQGPHSPNHNWTPTPIVTLAPQPVSARELEGRTGFAIVSFGETGRVLAVKLVDSTGQHRIPQLQESIASGITSKFQDERRHEHTAYLAYQIRRQEVTMRGRMLVALPMCCPCPGGCP